MKLYNPYVKSENTMGDMLNVPDTVPTTGSATGNPRNKIALKKGRSLMDWVKLGHTVSDLAGTGGKLLKVTPEELSKHNKRDDAWMALKGKVYNVTPYFEYHPGGEDELIKGAGKDATDLFNEVHKWVNFQSMLQKCHIGSLIESKSFFSKPNFLPLKKLANSAEAKRENNSTGFMLPPNITLSIPSLSIKTSGGKSPITSPLSPLRLPAPKYDWFQTKSIINIAIYTKWKDIRKWHVVIINHAKFFKSLVYINDQVFTVHLDLFKEVDRNFELKLGAGTGKIDIHLKKTEHALRWSVVGKSLPGNNETVLSKNREVEYLTLEVIEKSQITHNSFLIAIKVPDYIHFSVSPGHHVYLRLPGRDVVKPYTPVIVPFKIPKKEEEFNEKNIHIYYKVYPNGSVSPLLEALSLGDKIDVSFPEGTFRMDNLYQATQNASYLVLLGAGTGLTPLIKLLLESLKNEVKTILVAFNRTEEDIPWKVEFDSLVVTQSKLFRVIHVLSNPSKSWKSHKGHISRELLEEVLPMSGEESSYFCVCGTTGFTKLSLSILEEMEYAKENIFAFTG